MSDQKDDNKLNEAFDAAFIRRDHMAVILEKVRDDFRAFGEQLHGFDARLTHVEEKVDATFEEVGSLDIKITLLTQRIEKLEQRMDRMERDISSMQQDISVMKQDIAFIKERLTEKIDRSEFMALEKRVATIELKMQLK